MSGALYKRRGPVLLFAVLIWLPSLTVAGQDANPANSEKGKQENAKSSSKLMKSHLARANQAMQDAQAIRQRLQTAASEQNLPLLADMKTQYQIAINEYQQALQDAEVRDENGVRVIGLIGVIRNGLVSQQKAVEMLVQDPDLPVILSNLGMAYSGAGEYQEAVTILQQAAILKPAAKTYVELSTDLAQLEKLPEAAATCDKILSVQPTAQDIQASCYKNIAIVLTNQGRLADAIAPLEKATQLNPQDAFAWKLLGDALINSISSKSQNGQIVYIVPPGTMHAYEKYLQLEPHGPYAGQVRAALEGLAKLEPHTSPKETTPKN
jgi:tetratricopeptide (TPR) repeat protein